jgi:hypothetical protein
MIVDSKVRLIEKLVLLIRREKGKFKMCVEHALSISLW